MYLLVWESLRDRFCIVLIMLYLYLSKILHGYFILINKRLCYILNSLLHLKTCFSGLKLYRSNTRNADRVLHTCDRKYYPLKNWETIPRTNLSLNDCCLPESRKSLLHSAAFKAIITWLTQCLTVIRWCPGMLDDGVLGRAWRTGWDVDTPGCRIAYRTEKSEAPFRRTGQFWAVQVMRGGADWKYVKS